MNDEISDEDKMLFRKYLQGVKPLKEKGKAPKPLKSAKMFRPKMKTQESEAFSYYLSDYYSDEVGSEDILSYCASNCPKKQLKLLATGKIPYQSCLDLHGETVLSAQKALLSFLSAAKNKDLRAILIIHGKHSYNSKPPVLKNYLNHWLKQIPIIAAFHSALAKDGGTGAVYVKLHY